MASEVVAEGRTLEEARARAAAALGCPEEDLEVEVLVQEKAGLWPKGKGKVKIRAFRRQGPLDGLVQVTQGRVVVTDPQPGGQPAVLAPGPNVLVWVNDLPVHDPRTVSSQDQIKIEGKKVEAQTAVEVEVSPDGLSCTLKVWRRPEEIYAVEDAGPTNRLVLPAKLVASSLPPLSEEEVLAQLSAAGVVHGIDREAVRQAIEKGDGTPVVVARGTPPQPPVDARVEYPFLAKMAEVENASVDRRAIFSVEPGEILAVKKPGVPGSPGIDVYGRPIEPPPPKDAVIKAGKGAELREGGLVVATAVGRPEVRGSSVTVVPVYLIPGDVDARGGPIKFKGDVVVEGDVLDGVEIEAGGNVTVKGLVANSSVFAGGSIRVGGNVVGSTLKAGGLLTVWQKWDTFWQEAAESIEELVGAAVQLRQEWERVRGDEALRLGDGAVFKVLLETRLKRIPELLGKTWEALQELAEVMGLAPDHPLVEKVGELRRLLAARGQVPAAGLQELVDCLERTKQEAAAVREAAVSGASSAQIVAFYVQNSVLETTGQVMVNGKGCYNCCIYAGGGVVIEGSPGAFRGGQIISQGHVRIRQLGSPAEVKTYVQVPKNFYIRASEAFPGVLLKAGSRVEKVTARMAVTLLGE
jgi:uncharacterized protein (DUF342 family)